MTTLTPLPASMHVRELLEDLVGQDVAVEPGSPVDLDKPVETGVYVDDHLSLVGLVVVDLPLAASLASAIGLLPRGAVEGAVADGDIGTGLRENLHEVFNVLGALLNGEGLAHAKLHSTHAPGTVPADVAPHAATMGRRVDLVMDVGRYGRGRFSLVLA